MSSDRLLFQVQQVQEVPEDEDEGRQVSPVASDQAAAERDAGDPGDEPFSLSGAGVIIITTKDLLSPFLPSFLPSLCLTVVS